MYSWIPIFVLVTDAVIRVVLALHVIYKRRPVSATLAWLVLIAFVPILAVFIYLLVGETQLGLRRLAWYESFTKGLEREALMLWASRRLEAHPANEVHAQLARFGTAVWGLPAMRGNRLSLFGQNDVFLESLVKDIDAAREHAHLMYYIWTEDQGATRISEALIRAAQRGVECRVLVDGVGSWSFINGPLWKRLEAAGVKVCEAMPVNWIRRPFARVDLRNHRKIAVFDGRVGYCGSQNIHDTTFRSRRWRRTGHWVDASVRVEGPAAQALAVIFLRDWELDSNETFVDFSQYLPELTLGPDADCTVQIAPSGPGATPRAIQQAILTTIYAAREELVMTNPYFVPDESVLGALLAAAARGVKVTLILTTTSDAPLVSAASRACYPDLLNAGVEIWHYKPGMLHAKTITVDRSVALIGSTNMDNRSFFLNFEATMFVYDQNFASTLRFLQLGYRNDSRQITAEYINARPIWKIMRDNAAMLLGPLL